MNKISIIVPIYKVEDYIKRCCESLFLQSSDEIEYVFIDDASPDGSIQIVEHEIKVHNINADKVRIIRNEINQGVAFARKAGLENATGEYVLFVDADDWIDATSISKLLGTIKNKNVEIVGYNWYLEYSQGRRVLEQTVCEDGHDAFIAMMSGGVRWYLWSFLIKRSLFVSNNIQFIPGWNVGEDMMVLVKLFSCLPTFYQIKEPLYHYNQENTASVTRMKAANQISVVANHVYEVEAYIRDKYENRYDKEINFLKLNVKYPLLITKDVHCYQLWCSYFSDTDKAIWDNRYISIRSKVLQWMASHRLFGMVKLYNVFFDFIYKILYK